VLFLHFVVYTYAVIGMFIGVESERTNERTKQKERTMNETIKMFEVGNTYTARSICDFNCVFSFQVIKRTAKTITVNGEGKIRNLRPYIYNGAEQAMPLGRYSMAPVITA
jgi:hypothetical protein